MNTSLSYAQTLDTADALRLFRDEFIIPTEEGKEKIYFLGNSLGLQPRRTAAFIDKVLGQWNQHGVESFFLGSDPWMHYHDHLASPMARIVGAHPHEIVVMNQLTTNLHLLMVSFFRPQGARNKILCEAKAFPSDQYMMETHLKAMGLDPATVLVEISPREGEHCIRHEDILSAINDHAAELALVLWGGVNYYTGQVFDMASITAAARRAGAKVGFDLAHAAGNVELNLHEWNVDFACWCNYKYLNGGPGAVAAAFVHERYHKDPSIHRFAGWWGYDKSTRFLMQKGFMPIQSAEGWQLSTPSPILMACVRASLELFDKAGFPNLLLKGRQLSNYLRYLLEAINAEQEQPILQLITPADPEEKGCQLSLLMLQKGREVFDKLTEAGIYADWREPNVIRVAPVPLYNSFEEIWHFANILKAAL